MGNVKKRVVVQTETLDTLEKQLGWMHENVVDSLHDLLDVVPLNEYLELLLVTNRLVANGKGMVGTGSHNPQKGQGKPCGSCVWHAT